MNFVKLVLQKSFYSVTFVDRFYPCLVRLELHWDNEKLYRYDV